MTTVPFSKAPRVRNAPTRPQPKPQFLQMAAAQMQKEGKFGTDPTGQTSDAYESIQPTPQVD
jgi:hypothetical protein